MVLRLVIARSVASTGASLLGSSGGWASVTSSVPSTGTRVSVSPTASSAASTADAGPTADAPSSRDASSAVAIVVVLEGAAHVAHGISTPHGKGIGIKTAKTAGGNGRLGRYALQHATRRSGIVHSSFFVTVVIRIRVVIAVAFKSTTASVVGMIIAMRGAGRTDDGVGAIGIVVSRISRILVVWWASGSQGSPSSGLLRSLEFHFFLVHHARHARVGHHGFGHVRHDGLATAAHVAVLVAIDGVGTKACVWHSRSAVAIAVPTRVIDGSIIYISIASSWR